MKSQTYERESMTMTTISDLKKQLEENIQKVCKIDNGEIKLRDDLTIGDIMNLKSVESTINNILVVAQTCAFADEIGEQGIKNNISNPNAKGFDVDYNNGSKRILAELKATVPCEQGGRKYGSNQRKSISKDLENLAGISDKGKNAKIASNDQKCMVLIDVNGQSEAFEKLNKPNGYNASNIQVVYIEPGTPIAQYDKCGWN